MAEPLVIVAVASIVVGLLFALGSALRSSPIGIADPRLADTVAGLALALIGGPALAARVL